MLNETIKDDTFDITLVDLPCEVVSGSGSSSASSAVSSSAVSSSV